MKKVIMIAAMLLVSLAAVYAQSTMDKRQKAQRARIVQGRIDGDLTKKEVAHLKRQQRNIQRSECMAKADGVVTRKEQQMIHNKQQHANRSIRRARHNAAAPRC